MLGRADSELPGSSRTYDGDKRKKKNATALLTPCLINSAITTIYFWYTKL